MLEKIKNTTFMKFILAPVTFSVDFPASVAYLCIKEAELWTVSCCRTCEREISPETLLRDRADISTDVINLGGSRFLWDHRSMKILDA